MEENFKSRISNIERGGIPSRRARRFFLTALSLTILGVSMWVALFPQKTEPVYQGKSLSVWLDLYIKPEFSPPNQDADTLLRKQAAVAIRGFGTNAIPYYLELLETPKAPLAERFLTYTWSYHVPKLRAICIQRVLQARQNPIKAVNGFHLLMDELGTNATPAVRELLPLFNNVNAQVVVAPSFLPPPSRLQQFDGSGPSYWRNLSDKK